MEVGCIHNVIGFSFWLTGLTYHGKAADTWAVGVTLYCMILGQYPFLGETLQDTYDKVLNLLPLFFWSIPLIFSSCSTLSCKIV